MAHTLTIYYGETASSTISLALASGTGGAFLGDGRGNGGYTPATPIADVSYNASLYNDGARPRFSRYQNVFDDIEVTVSEASTDAALVTIGNIKKALWQARYYFEESNESYKPCYIAFKPHGSTNTAYSVLMGGYVDESSMDDSELINGQITVRIRLEREPFWRNYPPTMDWLTNSSKFDAVANNAKPWGTYAVSGVGGHIPALARVAFAPGSAGSFTMDKVVMGYRSGTTRTTYGLGVWELEATQPEIGGGLGTDCTATADATASPGGAGNTRVTCSFTTKTDADRMTVSAGGPTPGIYRVFLRAKCNSANTVTARLKYYNSWLKPVGPNYIRIQLSATKSTTAVTFSNTSWAMIDMGIVKFQDLAKSTGYQTDIDSTITIAASATTTASVFFDFLFLVPCDEYYLSMTGLNSDGPDNQFYFSNIEPAGQQYPISLSLNTATMNYYTTFFGMSRSLTAIGSGSLQFPVGSGVLVWMSGNSTWQNTFTATSNATLFVYRCQRYLTALGNG